MTCSTNIGEALIRPVSCEGNTEGIGDSLGFTLSVVEGPVETTR
jgi:hypothetical protein